MNKPPAPRKLPKQQRSRLLYESILQAGLELLDHQGESFTVERLCERAGISTGSLYQYFSDKNAVLAAIFQQVVRAEWKPLLAACDTALTMDFYAGQQHIGRTGLRMLRKLYKLDPNFYRNYGQFYLPHFPEDENELTVESLIDEALKQFTKLFQKHPRAQNLSAKQLEQLAFVYSRGSIAVVSRIIEERPDYLLDDWFMEQLTQLFCLDGMLQTEQSTSI